MKIGIIMYKWKYPSYSKHPVYSAHRIIYSWKEAEKFKKQGYSTSGITEDLFNFIALLERNKLLESTIKNFRRKYFIPENYKYDKLAHLPKKAGESKDDYERRGLDAYSEVYELALTYMMPLILKKDLALNLFYYGVIEVSKVEENLISISHSTGNKSTHENAISINLHSKHITKNRAITFIEKQWRLIDEELQNLPSMVYPKVSKRNLRIFDLRHQHTNDPEKQKLTWEKITDIITEEFQDEKDSSNMDMSAIRIAGQRATQTINSTFCRRKRKLKLSRDFLYGNDAKFYL